MKNVEAQLKGDFLIIGKDPRLVVNLKSQENYIETGSRKIPYRKKIQFSRDLLEEKQQSIFQTAVRHYYQQACQVAEEMKMAEQYRMKANRTVREKEEPL